MKHIIFIFFFVLGLGTSSHAQDDEKVKGDRNVTIKQTYVDAFNTIVIGEDFEVELFYNSKPSVEIETDDNLHEYIAIQVTDSVLTFKTTKDIRSSKKMNIKVNYGIGFTHIEVRENAEIRSLTSLELTMATLKTTGSSRAYLNIKASDFSFTGLDKAKVKLNVTAPKTKVELSDNCKMDALLNTKDSKIDLYQRATADIEGVTNTLLLRTDNNAQFNGKNFTSNICTAICEMASDAYIEVTEDITVEASGSSEIYLYSNPKITINRFTDTVKLQKKEK